MAIGNVIDRRKRNYDTHCRAIIEPSANDNCIGATQFVPEDHQNSFQEVSETTVSEIIERFSKTDGYFTIFLYDRRPQ